MTEARVPYCIVTGDFARTGGMDRANHALAEYLLDAGHPVHLVAHHVDDDLLAKPGATFHRVKRPLGAHLLGAPLLDLAGRRVARRVHKLGGRVIVNGGNCAVGDVNWVHYLHAAYTPEVSGSPPQRLRRKLQHRLDKWQERRALQAAKVIITNSHRTRADVITHVHVDPAKVRTVHLGLDVHRFGPCSDPEKLQSRAKAGWRADQPVVAFVGALGDRRKGFDTLFSAWHQLTGSGTWDVKLVVIGSGAELETWKARAREALMRDVVFLGFRSDVPDILNRCDLLVAPTRYEAYGLGIAEALCRGLPVLASRDAGVAELCPTASRTRLLLDDPNDANALASRLTSWLDDPAGYRSAGFEWTRAIRLRTWSLMAEQMVKVIQAHDAPANERRRVSLPDGADVSAVID